MRDLQELNLNDGGNPVSTPLPTDDFIRQLEKKLGVVLPQTYVQFVKFCNGGHPELDTVTLEADDMVEDVSVDVFLSITADENDVGGVAWVLRHGRGIPIGYFPFAVDGGGGIFVIDCGSEKYGGIFIIENDYKESRMKFVSDSFENLIDNLHINDDYI